MGDVASAIVAAGQGGASMRTGRVVGITGTAITVDVGGGQLGNFAYLDSYVPILGDAVQVLFQSPVPWVIGRSAGLPIDKGDGLGNVLPNPSFEADAINTVSPAGWTSYVGVGNTGTTSPRVRDAGPFGAADGLQFYEIYMTATGSSTYGLASDQVAVTPGQRWTAATSWQAYADGVSTPMVSPLVELHLVFQANAGDAYPTAVSNLTLMQGVGQFGSMPYWGILRDPFGAGSTVPAGAGFVRVVLLATNDCTGGAWFDKVILRRVT